MNGAFIHPSVKPGHPGCLNYSSATDSCEYKAVWFAHYFVSNFVSGTHPLQLFQSSFSQVYQLRIHSLPISFEIDKISTKVYIYITTVVNMLRKRARSSWTF